MSRESNSTLKMGTLVRSSYSNSGFRKNRGRVKVKNYGGRGSSTNPRLSEWRSQKVGEKRVARPGGMIISVNESLSPLQRPKKDPNYDRRP